MPADLARVRAAVVAGWRADVSVRPRGAWADLGGVAAHVTGLPVRHWNGAYLLTVPARLDRLPAFFGGHDVPWGLLVPAELEFVPPGLLHLDDQPLMVAPLPLPAPVWPAGLEVRPDAPASDVAAVQAQAFGDPLDLTTQFVSPQLRDPASRFLTAYDAEVPVGTAQVVMAGGSAGVYGVAVLERWRGRGLGRALTAAVAGLAAGRGHDRAHLNPSTLGRPVYERLGFRDVPPWRIWVPPG